MTTRKCARCAEEKGEGEFAARKYGPGRRHTTCRKCCSDLAKLGYRFCSYCFRWQWAKTGFHGKTKTRCATCMTANRYGMTWEEYEFFCLKNGEHCQICGQHAPLVVDHDHETGKPRGRLCHSCNVGLGHFKDSEALLAAAAKYLATSNERYTLEASLDDVFWPDEAGVR